MAKKVYVKGNYLYIEDTVTGIKTSGNAGSFEFLLINDSTDTYRVKKDTFLIFSTMSISEMQEEDGTPYTQSSFELFKETETGFSSASGGSGAVPIYGTSVRTGDKSISGKDIYKMYVNLNGKVSLDVLITGVDELTHYTGFGNLSSGAIKQLPYGFSSNWIEVRKTSTGNNIELFTNQTAQLSGRYAVIQYTKL